MSLLNNCIKKGSVKNLYKYEEDKIIFEYSNDYSIFDWGKMPDQLIGKGNALASMANFFFKKFETPSFWKDWQLNTKESDLLNLKEKISQQGVNHHSLNQIDSNGNESSESNLLLVKKMNIPNVFEELKNDKLVFNYDSYQSKPENTLIPLEVIFRFGCPKGSSLLNRYGKNQEYFNGLGLKKTPSEGELFENVIVEVSTKLEPKDRYISYEEGQEISSMSNQEFSDLINLTKILALRLYDFFKTKDLMLWDGKFEFAFGKKIEGLRELVLIDSIGPDELRLTHNGIQLSKEVFRQYYNNSHWKKNVDAAKIEAVKRNQSDWKKICIEDLNSSPENLEGKFKEVSESLYPTLENVIKNDSYQEQLISLSQKMEF